MKRSIAVLTIIMISNMANASDLIYRPNNPAFGGNAMTGSYLLNNAQAQNDTKSSSSSYNKRSDLDRFTDSLQSRMLSQLLADVGAGNAGSLQTDDFNIAIVDDGNGGLTVEVLDRNTNETTIISVNGLIPD